MPCRHGAAVLHARATPSHGIMGDTLLQRNIILAAAGL